MKNYLFYFFICVGVHGWGQNDTLNFKTPWELLDYSFQNTSFPINGSNFLTNRSFDIDEEPIDNAFDVNYLNNASATKTSRLMSLLKWWDLSKIFNDDNIYNAYFDQTQTYDYESFIDFPLVVLDVKVNTIDVPTLASWNVNASNNSAYPTVNASNTFQRDLFYLGFMEDSIPTNQIRLSLPYGNIVSNKSRQIAYVSFSVNGQLYNLYPGTTIDLSSIVSGLTDFQFTTHFNNGETVNTNETIFAYELSNEKSAFSWYNYSIQYEERLIVGQSSGLNNPKIKYHIFYACEDKKIHKPMIIFTGFGPYMWNELWFANLVNNNQNWPKPYDELLDQYNVGNQFEILREQGFDIIFAQVLPPNASINLNQEVIIKVINTVNNLKSIDGCNEENIIMGFSAGALSSKFALLKMEHQHLNNNGPHHYSKLFISNEGENLGANVPLAYQHMLSWLRLNEGWASLNTRALYYIFHAPLAQELLAYYYTETGTPDSPGQGSNTLRNQYLTTQSYYNHYLTVSENYPSFLRKISISNGSSVPDYTLSGVNHYPFPSPTGFLTMKQHNSNRHWEASFLQSGQHDVFFYRRKPVAKPWKVEYAARTNNPRLLDNAPGALFPFNDQGNSDKFVPKLINEQWESELSGSIDVNEPRNFSFVPTLYCHDIKNFNIDANYGLLNYNFKQNGLNYITEQTAFANNPIDASNFYGYPHLSYPSNHYNVTPFDALFTFNQNTSHLIGSRQINEEFFVGEHSAMIDEVPTFLLTETQPSNVYLQNRKIGYFTRPNFDYRADFWPKEKLIMGEHVTQNTDFLPLIFEANSESISRAGIEINLKPGVHIKNGADIHLLIESTDCLIAGKSGGENVSASKSATNEQYSFEIEMFDELQLYPNPSKNGDFKLSFSSQKIEKIEIEIYSITGQKINCTFNSETNEVSTDLKDGIYIVRVKLNNKWFIKKMLFSPY